MKKRRRLRDAIGLPLIALSTGRPIVNILHIGKTGGTALRAGLGIGKTDTLYTPSHIVHFRAHAVRMADVPRGQKIIFGLRDPVERFVSAFYSRSRRGRFGSNTWKPAEADAFAAFATPNDLGAALSSPDDTLRQRAASAMRSILHVRDGLGYWLGSEEMLRARQSDILYIFHQRTLDTDFKVMQRLLGVSSACSLPSDPVAAHRLPGTFDRNLSTEAATNVATWYARDYALIDVCGTLGPGQATHRETQIAPMHPPAAPVPSIAPSQVAAAIRQEP